MSTVPSGVDTTDPHRPALHVRLAEYGKLRALQGDHVTALLHYREAMRRAVHSGAPELVSRHYMECSLESLELMGAHAELLDYCGRALEHYRARPTPSPLARLDVATIHQRRGVVLLKLGDREQAVSELENAARLASELGTRLPLAQVLARWARARMHLTIDRITAEQRRHGYFSVRPDTVRPSFALPLPDDPRTTP